ncbi:MAG: hypothetical protein M1817_005344 [Caeruleum heppii]|nr:MAG: hypothetical protein M1817_005344 [Caeruleum heppii]
MCSSDIFLGLIAILFPPLAVWIKRGVCSADSLINIALSILGFIPGLLHAWYIIARYPETDYAALDQDPESGRVTYYYVNHRQQHGNQTTSAHNAGPVTYGTTEPMPRQGESQQQGSSTGGVPPTYDQAVKGDHKVQT